MGDVVASARGRITVALGQLGETEIEHLDRAVGGDLDVGGFEVAMDDALPVRGFERFGNLSGDGHRLVDAAGGPRVTLVGERRALDQLEDQR